MKQKKKKKPRFTLDNSTLDSISTSREDLYHFILIVQVYREEDRIGDSDPVKLETLQSLASQAENRWMAIVYPERLMPPWWGIEDDSGRFFSVENYEDDSGEETDKEEK